MSPDDLARILDELGQRLGPTGEHVFALAVRQVYIVSVMWTVIGLFLVAVAIACLVFGRRKYRADVAVYDASGPHTYDMGKPDWANYAMGVGFGVGFSLVIAFMALTYAIPGLLNPEYAALREILGAIHP